MDWQSTKEFLIDNTVLFGSLAAVAAIVGFLFAPIRNLLSQKKLPETADLEQFPIKRGHIRQQRSSFGILLA